MHRCVDGNHRRAFGRAIAFEDAQAEFLHPRLARFRLHPLRPRHHEAHVEEVIRMGIPRIAHEEGIRAEHYRRVGFVTELRNNLVVEGRGVKECPDTRKHRQQHATRQSEGMEHGKGVEHHIR